MSIGEWQPEKKVDITLEKLQQYVDFARLMKPEDLAQDLPEDLITTDRVLMKKPVAAWQVADALDSDDLVDLIRFFTLAEQQLPGWSAGKSSPVIPLVKILRTRSALEPALRKWIKANTDNRFLPNGAVL